VGWSTTSAKYNMSFRSCIGAPFVPLTGQSIAFLPTYQTLITWRESMFKKSGELA
jgi:hypothetical protein